MRQPIRLSRWALAGIIAVQVGFIGYGLALFFWTVNEWLSDRPLNALFGGGLGLFFFFGGWRLLRAWVRRQLGFGQ